MTKNSIKWIFLAGVFLSCNTFGATIVKSVIDDFDDPTPQYVESINSGQPANYSYYPDSAPDNTILGGYRELSTYKKTGNFRKGISLLVDDDSIVETAGRLRYDKATSDGYGMVTWNGGGGGLGGIDLSGTGEGLGLFVNNASDNGSNSPIPVEITVSSLLGNSAIATVDISDINESLGESRFINFLFDDFTAISGSTETSTQIISTADVISLKIDEVNDVNVTTALTIDLFAIIEEFESQSLDIQVPNPGTLLLFLSSGLALIFIRKRYR